jgi:hypothetical protein
MQASNIPVKFPIPWANSATAPNIRPIPVASQIGVQNGAASLTDGFPPNCFIPEEAGGVGPFGSDTNGILNQETLWSRWLQAGGPIAYDPTFQGEIGGYPSGALIQSAAFPGVFWQSSVDNNTTNPDTGGEGWVSFPQRGIQAITVSGNFTVPAGVTILEVEMWGGGGGSGSGAPGNGGSGGGGGGYSHGFFSVTPGQVIPVTVGTGGAPTNAGTISEFLTMAASGGAGGASNSDVGSAGGIGEGGTENFTGQSGNGGSSFSATAFMGGAGGGSPRGALGTQFAVTANGTSFNGTPGFFPGGGASGGAAASNASTSGDGRAGANGQVVVKW